VCTPEDGNVAEKRRLLFQLNLNKINFFFFEVTRKKYRFSRSVRDIYIYTRNRITRVLSDATRLCIY